jgi:amicyanin
MSESHSEPSLLLALRIGSLWAAILITLAACGGSAAGASSGRSYQGAAAHGAMASMEGAAVATPSVTISGYAFHPATVTIKAGSTVTWTQEDTDVHTVHFGGAGGFTSPVLQKGLTFSHTFKSPGTYAYSCSIHPYMHGTVVVTS